MDAASVEKIAQSLPNFGGIFYADQLAQVKVVSYPVSFIIYENAHWSSIYIDIDCIEIMDSAGLMPSEDVNKTLKNFICNLMPGKDFLATPQIQSQDSEACGKFALSFLYYRTWTGMDLLKFCEKFSSNYELNESIINKMFDAIAN